LTLCRGIRPPSPRRSSGYGADDGPRAALAERMSPFTVVRCLGEARWPAQHGLPFESSLQHAAEWRAG